MMELGDYLKQARENVGWSQRRVAREIGINFTLVSKIEKGEAGLSEPVARGMAAIYNLDSDDLLYRAGKLPSDVEGYLIDNPSAVRIVRQWMIE